MKKSLLQLAAFICAFIGMVLCIFPPHPAQAHSGSPAAVTWSNGNTLTVTDLNNTVAHMHNTFSGGIVDAHLAANAAIQHTKVATPALLPKAWAMTTARCTASPCTVSASSGVTSITRSATGTYTLTWGTTRADALYMVQVTPFSCGTPGCSCQLTSLSTTTSVIRCTDSVAGDDDVGLHVLMLDNDT